MTGLLINDPECLPEVTLDCVTGALDLQICGTVEIPVCVGVPGAPGGQVLVWEQTTPSASWLINHSFGRYPSVSLYDDLGSQFFADIGVNDFDVVVTLETPYTGKAVLT
jgi:hypothetical protein